MVKTENIAKKIEQQYFQTRGAYYTRKYGYFNILRAKVGVRIIRGCVLYAENYGIHVVQCIAARICWIRQYVLIRQNH